ncbi:hypothetical protein SH611_02705 [Geminicoccaceae bacterium 1502E]|nr:hypothetical protein [Geminicoccaceae bacterium 1502E]
MTCALDELAAMVDTLLPGDGIFPPASAAGTVDKLAQRLGGPARAALLAAIEQCGGPLGPLDPEARRAVVERLERGHRGLFETVLRVAFLGYYGSEPVAAAMRAGGLDYRLTPQPEGYAMQPFDEERDRPRHPRGSYRRTEEVRRVELPEGLA